MLSPDLINLRKISFPVQLYREKSNREDVYNLNPLMHGQFYLLKKQKGSERGFLYFFLHRGIRNKRFGVVNNLSG